MTRPHRLRILVLTKRQYTHKDLIDDRFGRIREIPLHLARKGHSVKGLCLSYRRRKGGAFQDESVRWESINAGPLFVGGLLRLVVRAMQLAREADVIWACSDSIFGIIGLFISRALGIPVVFDLYDNFESFLLAKIPVFKELYRHAVRKCDAVTVVSRPLFELVRSYGRSDAVYLVENAVNSRLFKPLDKQACRSALKLPAGALIIGTAGALFRNRGIEALFGSFLILAEKYPNLFLAVAGPREEPIPVHLRILDMGTLSYEKIPKFLNALDIGVICNRPGSFGSNCFPQKAREMMACGLPIIAADVGSMRALLADHPQWLFRPESATHLSAAIENRLRDLCTDYGHIPTWSELARNVLSVFQQVAGSPRQRPDYKT